MIKIKIHNIDNHRVETTFRPYLFNKTRSLFREIDVKFVLEGNDWDMLWIAHPSFVNRFIKYDQSVEHGIEFVNNQCTKGDVFLFDGSDSCSLMGSWDVFKKTDAKLLFKNQMFSDLSVYSEPSSGGRGYWGTNDAGFYDYSIQRPIENVQLSGCNWLSTVEPQWFDYTNIDKPFDICALFSYPSNNNSEWNHCHSLYYDRFRKTYVDILEGLKTKFKVLTLDNGKKLPPKEYYQMMQQSKIVFAPFGYGEMAPRDVESNMFGSILMKPNMSHLQTVPNVYNSSTFVSIDWEGTNMENEIERVVGDFTTLQRYYVDNFRKEFVQRFDPQKLVEYTYNWISKLDGYGTD